MDLKDISRKYKNIKIFDLESDNLYFDVTKIHVTSIQDLGSDVVKSYTDPLEAIEELKKADLLVGHNIIGYDLPVFEKLHNFKYEGDVFDTLIASRLIWTNMFDVDFNIKRVPKNLKGRHSLESWGYRLKFLKGDFGKVTENAWDVCTPAMIEYCEQDVRLSTEVFLRILKEDYAEEALTLEMDFATIISKQVIHGWRFDVKKAQGLYVELLQQKLDLVEKLQEIFPPIYISKGLFTPKRDDKRKGYIKGATMTKVELTPFNAGSRSQIAQRFIKKYKWKPKIKTDGGQPKISEDILMSLKYPEAKFLAKYFMLDKRLGMLGDGKGGYLKMLKGDRLYGNVNTMGAITGRCTHSNPNLAQVPSIKSAYGHEFRSLFIADKGGVMVGCDASGLELRCLAHYMRDPEYIDLVLNGDIHSYNQKAAGLPTRDNAKTFIYGFLYGAGDEKIGKIVGKGRKEGKILKQKFLDNTPALKSLRERVKQACKRGYVKGLDGRKIIIRSDHAALNSLLQGAGAVVMKKALILFYKALNARGYVFGDDYAFVGNIHDEYQASVNNTKIKDDFKLLAVQAIRDASEHFKFRCPLDAEAKEGLSWAETH